MPSWLRLRAWAHRSWKALPWAEVLALLLKPLAPAAWTAFLVAALSLYAGFAPGDSWADDVAQRWFEVKAWPTASHAPSTPGILVVEVDDASRYVLGKRLEDRGDLACYARGALAAGARLVALDYALPPQGVDGGPPAALTADAVATFNHPRVVYGVVTARTKGVLAEVPPAPSIADPDRQNWGGLEMLATDGGGPVRAYRAYARGLDAEARGDEPLPSFALVAWAAAAKGWSGQELRERLEQCRPGAAARACDADLRDRLPGQSRDKSEFRLVYAGAEARFQRSSAASLFPGGSCDAGAMAPELAGKVVIIGPTHALSADRKTTPPATLAWAPRDADGLDWHGVHVHALALSQLMTATFLPDAPWWPWWAALLVCMGSVIAAGYGLHRWSRRHPDRHPSFMSMVCQAVVMVAVICLASAAWGFVAVSWLGVHPHLASVVPWLLATAGLAGLLHGLTLFYDAVFKRHWVPPPGVAAPPPQFGALVNTSRLAAGACLWLARYPGEHPASYADRCNRVERDLRDELAGVASSDNLVLVDNWAFGRLCAFVIPTPPGPTALGAASAALEAAVSRVRLRCQAVGWAPVGASVAQGELAMLDLLGSADLGVMTFAGPLPECLAASAAGTEGP